MTETPETAAEIEVDEKSSGWLELFYDLVFVVVIARIAGLLLGDPSIAALGGAFGLTVIVWLTWFNVSALTDIAGGVPTKWRVFIFASMAGVAIMALGITDLRHGRDGLFVLGIAVARTAVWPLWAVHRKSLGMGTLRPLVYGPGLGALWLLSALVPRPWIWWVWGALVLGEAALTIFGNPRRHRYMLNGAHMIERVGSFLMIVLGECLGQIINTVDTDRDAATWAAAGLALALECAKWWLVYEATVGCLEDALESRAATRIPLLQIIGGGQLLMVVGLVSMAGGLAGAVTASAPTPYAAAHLADGTRTALCAGLALVVLGVASISRRVWSVSVSSIERGALGLAVRALILSLPLAAVWWFGRTWHPILVLAALLVLTAAVIQRQMLGQRVLAAYLARTDADVEQEPAAPGRTPPF